MRRDLAAWLSRTAESKDPADGATQEGRPPGAMVVGSREWKKKIFKAKEAERVQKEAKQVMNQVTGSLLQKYATEFQGDQLKAMM